jgi:hypothetical protein
VGEKRLGHDEDVVDEHAAKDGVRDDRRKWTFPLLAVSAEQFVLAGFQFGAPRIIARQAGPLDLDAYELAARVAALVEVIGVDEPGQVVIGRGAGRPQERGVVGVHKPLFAAEARSTIERLFEGSILIGKPKTKRTSEAIIQGLPATFADPVEP